MTPLPSWQQQLKTAFRDVDSLLAHLQLQPDQLPYAIDDNNAFRQRVPRFFADLMQKRDPYDPLLLQVLPQALENQTNRGFTADPLQELDGASDNGIVHKYQGRALTITTGVCAVNCRYCFRRHYPYDEHALGKAGLQEAMQRIQAEPEIHEVILSGGDPLMLDDHSLKLWLQALEDSPQINSIRLHTRVPVVLPSRITEALVHQMAAMNTPVTIVIHANHGNEISTELTQVLRPLRAAGVMVLNQSVLLAGINDDIDTLADLSAALIHAGVLPYYLHQMDAVIGAAHFAVEDDKAIEIHRALLDRLPGYWVPRLVREEPGAKSKTAL